MSRPHDSLKLTAPCPACLPAIFERMPVIDDQPAPSLRIYVNEATVAKVMRLSEEAGISQSRYLLNIIEAFLETQP